MVNRFASFSNDTIAYQKVALTYNEDDNQNKITAANIFRDYLVQNDNNTFFNLSKCELDATLSSFNIEPSTRYGDFLRGQTCNHFAMD